MTRRNIALSFVGLLFVSLIALAAFVSDRSVAHSAPAFDTPPVAVNDTFTRHDNGAVGNVLTNDFDPDGGAVIGTDLVTQPSHGTLQPLTAGFWHYQLTDRSYVGTDSFTYRACGAFNICSAPATVTINVVNQAPTAVNDSYTVHGHTIVGPLLVNDSDPEGDSMTWVPLTQPTHGTLNPIAGTPPFDRMRFEPANPYTGPDSFTYKVCDALSLCSAPATVSINIVNNPPITGPESYVVRGSVVTGRVQQNDSDPDGDQLASIPQIAVSPAHGQLLGAGFPQFFQDQFRYTPEPGFTGVDSFVYRACDLLLKCTEQTVTLYVEGDAANLGSCQVQFPAGGPRSVGEPVDVTNGNMYLRQTDYVVPGVGHKIDLQRSYNSQSTRTGLFGKGWSTTYDESLQVYDAHMLRLNEADGRATYFGRAIGSSGPFLPLETDFHGEITQTAGGYMLSLKNGSFHQFNSTGRLLSLTDVNANVTSLQYNLSGKISSVTDPFGRVLSFLVNLSGRVTAIADTTGIVAEYTYGGSSELLTITYADNSGYTFAYDTSLRLTSASDKLGNVLESHAYDSQGRATNSQKHGGVELYTLSYVSATRTDVTDALGRVTKYFFDKTKARNIVTSVEGVCSCGGSGSQLTTWAYDSNLNVTSTTDALGHATSYTYDTAGNMLTVTNPTGTITYTYNSRGQVLTRTDQMSGVTTNTYSSTGDLLTSKDPLNNTTTFTYDSRGQLLTVTDARNKVTTLTWDTSGRPTQMRDALNNTTNFAYNLRARLTSATNALNHTTSYEYDSAGRVKKVIYPDNNFAELTYDLAGRRTKVKDPRGNETNFAYDAAYRLISVTDALSHTTTYTYDLMSNPTSFTDALSRVTNYEYDDFNRLKKIIYPPAFIGATRLEETMTYDAAGNLTKNTDTAGRDTTYAYDSVNRLTQITNPALQVTQFQYNSRSQQTTVIDALSQQYSFVYDPLGRVTQSTRAGTSMSYAYDAVGNLTQRTDYNGAITTYVHDDLNRLTTVTYPDTTTASYGYDVLSRITSAANQNGTITFGYDSRNRLTSTTDVWGQTIGYSYDANGNRAATTLGGSPYTSYQYDVVDRLTTLTDNVGQNFTYNYDVVNRLTSRLAPNGVTTTFTYDGLDRLFELSHTKSPATLGIHQYGYNNANNLTSWLGSAGNRSFNYDGADRLTSVLKMGGNESYGYDAVGNRTSSHLSTSYTYQPLNKLTGTTSATYAYDNNGALSSKVDGAGTRTLAWDSESRLKQVTLPGGVTTNYKYDALGRRIQRTTSAGADERYVYDGQNVVADLNSSSAVTTSYINGLEVDDHLRQTNTSTGVSYFLSDHLGTTAALTDGSGNVIETLSYDSFGNNAGSTRTRYTYTGRERDPDTGLLYYRARFYDPQLGRFISEDPIGLAGGINLQAYVSNNPIQKRDPFGLYDIDVHYYLTYYLALKTGCFTDAQARDIGFGNQDSDEHPDKAPGWGNMIVAGAGGYPDIVPDYAQRARNVAFHAFGTNSENAKREAELFAAATAHPALGHFSFGTYLHFVQDSFSHADYAGNDTWGQTTGGKRVDHTNHDPGKAMDMAKRTFFELRRFAEKNGCKCTGEPDWNVVDKFIKVGFSSWNKTGFVRDVSDKHLRQKIEILGVPWRSPNGR